MDSIKLPVATCSLLNRSYNLLNCQYYSPTVLHYINTRDTTNCEINFALRAQRNRNDSRRKIRLNFTAINRTRDWPLVATLRTSWLKFKQGSNTEWWLVRGWITRLITPRLMPRAWSATDLELRHFRWPVIHLFSVTKCADSRPTDSLHAAS